MNLLRRICNRPRWLGWTIVINLAGCSLAYWAVEGKGPITSAWWAIVSGSTTGYGDQFPTTTAGRGIAAWLIVSMVALVQVAGAQLTRNLLEDPNAWTHDEQEEIKQDIRDTADTLLIVQNQLAAVIQATNAERHLSPPPFRAEADDLQAVNESIPSRKDASDND